MSKHAPTSNLVRSATLLAIFTLASLTACDPPEPGAVEPRASGIDPVPVPANADTTDQLGTNPASAAADGSLHEKIMALQPQRTRAGWLRITDPIINTPEAAPILLERLRAGDDAPEVRAALAEAIGRTQADYAGAVSELIVTEPDPRVRELLVGTLGRQTRGSEAAQPGLDAALVDADPTVRAAAARTIADRKDGAAFADGLIALLQDQDTKVRSDTARSLGVLQIDAAKQQLVALLSDADAEVRLQGLRALDRIDPSFAASQAPITALEQDADLRVSRLAAKIRQR